MNESISPNRRTALRNLGYLSLGSFLCIGCHTVPVTQRKQLLLIPEGQEITLGSQAFQETLDKEPASQNTRLSSLVNRVGKRIAAVAGRNDYAWEFRLISSPQQNAFCLPGGKVAIYEGILPVCQNEAGLAVVMSMKSQTP
jgi:predicted Zn-dependent protease